MYYPSSEPDAVLGCGCVVSMHGAIKVIGGGGKWYQSCDRHEGPVTAPKGIAGTWEVIREANADDRIGFFFHGRPAPKRANRNASKRMRDVPIAPAKEAHRIGNVQPTLF